MTKQQKVQLLAHIKQIAQELAKIRKLMELGQEQELKDKLEVCGVDAEVRPIGIESPSTGIIDYTDHGITIRNRSEGM